MLKPCYFDVELPAGNNLLQVKSSGLKYNLNEGKDNNNSNNFVNKIILIFIVFLNFSVSFETFGTQICLHSYFVSHNLGIEKIDSLKLKEKNK